MAKKHLKRLFAPKDWMLSKLTGVFAPKPNAGPHKLRESLPLLVILRNRLKYALNAREANMIVRQGLIKIDGRARSDPKYPTGFQDVIEIPKTGERFRLMYDVKGRFALTKISETESNVKLCKVTNVWTSNGRIPMITTHDGRRIRYPDPKISNGDTVVVNVRDGKISQIIKQRTGKIALVTGGANRGRIGELVSVERHPGSFDISRLKDKAGNEFATRSVNVFAIGNTFSTIPITLPKQEGQKISPFAEREAKLILAETNRQKRATKTVQKKTVKK